MVLGDRQMGFFSGSRHKNELDIPAPATDDPKGVEIARIWAAGGRQVVTLRAEIWNDPAAWGLMLVDLAKHVANAHEQLGKGTKEEVLQRIKQGFDAEWTSATDEPTGGVHD
jgi:hypothetical protein